MKLTCSIRDMLAACQLVAPAVSARTTKPVLENLKAEATDSSLTLTAYDMEVGIRYTVPGVTVTALGACILPLAELVQILRRADGGDVTLDVSDQHITVRVPGARYNLPVTPVAEFPDLPAFDADAPAHTVTANALRELIRRTAFAANKKDTTARFSLAAVLWHVEAGAVELVGTDTKRLSVARASAALTGEPPTGTHLVPLKAVGLLSSCLDVADGSVSVTLRPNDALFRVGPALIYTALVQGKFPPYRDIFAKAAGAANVGVAVPTATFLTRVRQAEVTTDNEAMRVDLTFGSGAVVLRANGPNTGASEVTLALPGYSGPKTEIAFDPVYLTEFLRAADGAPEVGLKLAGGEKPAVFTCGEEWKYLVMP
ncbi:MAG TPA: DNA polymerase III subunit beta, partial [Gemmata sp.]